MIPIAYRWDDVGAPVARGEKRSLCDILYACLVTGYGSKLAAGWTRPFVNATFDRAVFRNNPVTGTGFYLQVDGLTANTGYGHNMKAFEVMTSDTAGTFPFNASVQLGYTSNQAGTTARPWVLIADDRAFYLFIWSSNASSPAPTATQYQTWSMFFGDGVKRYPSDAYFCLLSVGPAPTAGSIGGLNNPSTAAGQAYNGYCVPRPINGTASPKILAQIKGGGPGSENTAGDYGLAYTAGDEILVSRPHLNDATAYTFRGWLPGFYYPCHPKAFGQLVNVNVSGMDFMSLRHAVYYTEGNSFIHLGDWRA